jgi:hypothetical protein
LFASFVIRFWSNFSSLLINFGIKIYINIFATKPETKQIIKNQDSALLRCKARALGYLGISQSSNMLYIPYIS